MTPSAAQYYQAKAASINGDSTLLNALAANYSGEGFVVFNSDGTADVVTPWAPYGPPTFQFKPLEVAK